MTVVGAGPAGSTTAYRLAGAGARVLLIDKARFPGDKPCGGGISARAWQELPIDPSPVVEHVVDKMELSFGGRRSFIRGGRRPLAHMTQRRCLDHFLVEQAADAGAEFRDGVVTEASEQGVRVDGRFIASQLIVGADGANGATAKSLGLENEREYGVALEGNLAHRDADPDRWLNTALIELNTLPGGYCWVFPKGDHLNVGLGGWERTGPILRRKLDEWSKQRGFDSSKLYGLRGYRLPGRRAGAPLARGRALLVGDAGGLIDPLWGDGMYSAFLSSRLAAETCLKFLAGEVSSLEEYASALLAKLGSMMSFAWNAKIALDRFPRLAFAGVVSPPGWQMVENSFIGVGEPAAGLGIGGLAVRGLEAWGRHRDWPGCEYRTEAETRQPTASST